MINIRFDVACIPLYTCRTSEDFSSSCKACPEWPRCRSTERMQARNSVYESSRSAKCPRLGRANILPDRCQWWWGSEGRAPPETMIPTFHRTLSMSKSSTKSRWKKKMIFPSIFESQSRDLTSSRSERGSFTSTRGNTISIFRRQDVRHVGIETFRFAPQAKCRFA